MAAREGWLLLIGVPEWLHLEPLTRAERLDPVVGVVGVACYDLCANVNSDQATLVCSIAIGAK